MGLDIVTTDYEKNFKIGYFGFTFIRTFFILGYDEELYPEYREITKCCGDYDDKDWRIFINKLGDLSILITHSDCDGELTSKECKKLKKCLKVDEDKILNTNIGTQYYIDKLYEFIDIVDYCAMHDEVKLIFG